MTLSRKMQGLLALSIVAVSSGAAAERAAGIEYEFVPRPADILAEYDAPGRHQSPIHSIKAIDGSVVDAALWQPGGDRRAPLRS